MKITIDTKEDNAEEIKKVIELLSSLLKSDGTQSVPNNIFETSKIDTRKYADFRGAQEHAPYGAVLDTNEMPNVMGMFDAPATSTELPKTEEKKDIPKVELY